MKISRILKESFLRTLQFGSPFREPSNPLKTHRTDCTFLSVGSLYTSSIESGSHSPLSANLSGEIFLEDRILRMWHRAIKIILLSSNRWKIFYFFLSLDLILIFDSWNGAWSELPSKFELDETWEHQEICQRSGFKVGSSNPRTIKRTASIKGEQFIGSTKDSPSPAIPWQDPWSWKPFFFSV